MMRGQWIVCLVDLPSGQTEYIGPFHSEERADEVARRLRLNINTIGATEVV